MIMEGSNEGSVSHRCRGIYNVVGEVIPITEDAITAHQIFIHRQSGYLLGGDMILLSEEEIINMVTDFHFSGETNRHILCNKVAKAQVKKVDKVVDDYFKKNAWMTREGWKALLKEVEWK